MVLESYYSISRITLELNNLIINNFSINLKKTMLWYQTILCNFDYSTSLLILNLADFKKLLFNIYIIE